MAVISSDTLQLAVVQETVPGQIPATPAFNLWRTTGESLVFSPQTSENTEIGGGGRSAQPANVTGMQVNGSINFTLSKFPALEQAIAGVLASQWGACPLTGAVGGGIDSANDITVGQALKTFTIEKRFPSPSAVVGAAPTVAAGATGGTTVDYTFAGVAAVGTGAIEVSFQVAGSLPVDVNASIAVGDDADAAAASLAAAITAASIPGITAAAVADTVTVTSAGGNFVAASGASGNDQYLYQRFSGVTYSALSLSVSPNADVTGSVTLVGGVPMLSSLPIPGATYVGAGTSPVFTAPDVMELSVGTMGLSTHCWTSLNINVDSANRGIPCIGSSGDREVVLGTLTAEVSGDVYFSDQTVLEALLANETLGDTVVTLSNGTDLYRFDFFDMKPTAGQLAAGGQGQDLTIPISLSPTPTKVCDDGAGNDWTAGFIVSKEDTAPVLP